LAARLPPPLPSDESLAPRGRVSPLERPLALDRIVVAYVLATVALVLLASRRIPAAGTLAVGHGLGLAVYALLRSAATRGVLGRAVFLLSLAGLVLGVFEGMGAILPHLRADVVADLEADALLARLDRTVFGSDPTTWFEAMLSPATVLVLQICYASYFFLAFAVIAVTVARRHYRSLISYTAVIIGTFFTTYVGYYLLPAYGPRVYHAYPTEIPHHAVSRWLYDAIESLDYIKLNAFPSGHAAVALVVLAILFREDRKVAAVFVPLVAGLVVATVALRYHYLVDVVVGVLIAALWSGLGMRVVFAYDRRPWAAPLEGSAA